jgi:hypothetical protein
MHHCVPLAHRADLAAGKAACNWKSQQRCTRLSMEHQKGRSVKFVLPSPTFSVAFSIVCGVAEERPSNYKGSVGVYSDGRRAPYLPCSIEICSGGTFLLWHW